MPTIKSFETKEALAQAAADSFAELAREAIAERGRFAVALSGGSTPILMYRRLIGATVDWPRVVVFWSDDRFVPASDPESNQGAAERELIHRVPVGASYGIYRPGSPQEAAEQYEQTLRHVLGNDPTFDLVLLGMGPDGHTASMFPGDPSVGEKERLVVASRAPVGVADRVTFTIPLIRAAKKVILLIAGRDKEEAWSKVRSGFELPTTTVLDASPNAEVYVSI